MDVGPGSYTGHEEWGSKIRIKNVLRAKSQKRGKVEYLNPPSIPTNEYRFGYKQAEDGYHMVNLKSPDAEITYNKFDTAKKVGPATY